MLVFPLIHIADCVGEARIADRLLDTIGGKAAPAAETTFSSIMILPKSLAPDRVERPVYRRSATTPDIDHIGQHDSADGDHADIFIAGDGIASAFEFAEQGAFIHKRPGE